MTRRASLHIGILTRLVIRAFYRQCRAQLEGTLTARPVAQLKHATVQRCSTPLAANFMYHSIPSDLIFLRPLQQFEAFDGAEGCLAQFTLNGPDDTCRANKHSIHLTFAYLP